MAEEQQKFAAAMNEGTSAPVSAYVDGGMHSKLPCHPEIQWRKGHGIAGLRHEVPYKPPEAALADPFASAR